jgi:hypothetical protein
MALSSPSLRTCSPPPPSAADDCAVAFLLARDRPVRTRGVPNDRPANTRYSLVPMRAAPALDCRRSPHPPAAWRAATAAVGRADNLPSRSTVDRELADTAETPPRTRHTAALPSMRLRPANLSGVRYRSAINELVTNATGDTPSCRSIQWVHFYEHRWVNSCERQGSFRRTPCTARIAHPALLCHAGAETVVVVSAGR